MTKAHDFTIRRARAADDAQWRELFLAYGVFYNTAFDSDVLSGVWKWIMDPHHPVTAWVADHEGTLLGFAHVREQPDTFRAGPSWFLDDLFTTPSARGQGVATALINHARAVAADSGGGDMRWITAADNVRAQRIYDTLATKTTWVTYELDTMMEDPHATG
jgi:GNAT superfamily N-acetyltransferase